LAGTRNLSFSCRKIKNKLAAAPVSVAIHGQASWNRTEINNLSLGVCHTHIIQRNLWGSLCKMEINFMTNDYYHPMFQRNHNEDLNPIKIIQAALSYIKTPVLFNFSNDVVVT
jgi:hypothetical protein